MYRVGGNSYPNTLHAVTRLLKMVLLSNRIILIPILNCGTYKMGPHWAFLLCVKVLGASQGRGCQMVQVMEQRLSFKTWRGPRYFQIRNTVYSIESRYFHTACWRTERAAGWVTACWPRSTHQRGAQSPWTSLETTTSLSKLVKKPGEQGSSFIFLSSAELIAKLSGFLWENVSAALQTSSVGLWQPGMQKLSLEEGLKHRILLSHKNHELERQFPCYCLFWPKEPFIN